MTTLRFTSLHNMRTIWLTQNFYLKADREAEGMVGEAVNFLMLWNVRADEKYCLTIILADKLYFLKKHSLDCRHGDKT